MKSDSNCKLSRWILLVSLFFAPLGTAHAQVPGLLNYQGRVFVGANTFEGNGQFKFALVNLGGTQVYWLSSEDGNGDGQPDNPVTLAVTKGLYSVILGDDSIPNMAIISPSVFSNPEVYLRVWFDDGASGFQQLTPDQRLVAVGYALMAADVVDGSITQEKLSTSLAEEIAELTQQIDALTDRLDDFPNSGLTVASTSVQDTELQGKGFEPFSSVPAPAWENGTSTDAASARYGHSAVWTGQEMIVWGGNLASGVYSSSGAMYSAVQDHWDTLSPLNAPQARSGHTAVWSGQEMIVWGGFSESGYVDTGAEFVPSTQQWTSVPTTGPLAGRSGHISVWIGNRMFVWGGGNAAGLLNDGAVYDPGNEQWTGLSLANPPEARTGALAVWTGNRVLIWGGEGASGSLNSGVQLLFDGNGNPIEWRPMSASGAPSGRVSHGAVWTGEVMIVWGGESTGTFLGNGAVYDPESDSWNTLSASGAPTPRGGHSAVWTGQEIVIYGGATTSGEVSDGGAYDPEVGSWRALSAQGSPVSRTRATMIWSGSELLVFGGQSGGQSIGLLQRLNPKPTWYFYRKQ